MRIRDWSSDVCSSDLDAIGECFNIGGGAELPNLTVIETLCAAVDDAFARDPALAARFPDAPAARGRPSSELKTYVADRPGHDRRYAIDERKIAARLGYRPTRDFATGLAQTIAWYLANEGWWRAVQDGSYREWLDRNYAGRDGQAA